MLPYIIDSNNQLRLFYSKKDTLDIKVDSINNYFIYSGKILDEYNYCKYKRFILKVPFKTDFEIEFIKLIEEKELLTISFKSIV